METALTVLFAPAGLIVLSSISLYQFTVLWRRACTVQAPAVPHAPMSAANTRVLVIESAPALCILVFAISVNSKSGSAAWKAVQPALKQLEVVLENSLGGSPSSFKTNPTHVLLVAVLLAVLIAGERVRGAARR